MECTMGKTDIESSSADKEMIIENIEQGDLVDFGVYGMLYVTDVTSYKRLFWVTPDKNDRFNQNCAGFSLEKVFAMEIIEKALKI